MSTGKRRVFEREFKVSAVERLLAGESAAALSHELEVSRGRLSQWCGQYRRYGPEGLRRAGRPRQTDAKLERGSSSAIGLERASRAAGRHAAELKGGTYRRTSSGRQRGDCDAEGNRTGGAAGGTIRAAAGLPIGSPKY
jgi:transposase-like protein